MKIRKIKKLSHYLSTLGGISLKFGLGEYRMLRRKLDVYAASELSADVKKIPPEQQEQYYKKIVRTLWAKDGLMQERICRAVQKVRANACDDAFRKDYEELIREYGEMEPSEYTHERWKTISIFLVANGLFRLGELCREKAGESLMRRGYRAGDHFRRAVWYLEADDLPHAREEICKTSSSHFMKKYRKSDLTCAKIYYNILCEGSDAFEIKEKMSQDKREEDFYAFAAGGDFLVIGPAPRSGQLEADVLGYRVVRSNDRGEDHGGDPASSVSYYNGQGSRWISGHGGEEFASRFDFVAVKHECRSLDVPNMHRTGDFNCLLPVGHLNMLPLMVLDLSYNDARNIYVCGNNLFFSRNPWKKGYQSAQLDWNRTNFWPGLSNHEIYSQFHLLKNTYRHHAFTADEELKNVLSMTVREYAAGMEKIYSIPEKESQI